MAKLFFLLSGEHENLPTSEIKAILEAESYTYRILEKLDQVVRLEANLSCIEAIKRRAAFAKLCGLELFTCKAQVGIILKTMREVSLEDVLKDGEHVAVRVKHVRNYSSNINGMTLEIKLGETILKRTAKAKVNLRKPDKIFVGILTNEKFVFGIKLADISPKPFVERRPKKKPFFHPSAMMAKHARCMVNLAKPKTGEIVFDPFCGTGSMLVEAALIGCRVLGLDAQRRMVKGTARNLAHFGIRPDGIVVADALNPPITKVDCVVTDPPYGISATTLKRPIRQIFRASLMSVYGMLDKGRRVCMAAPKTLNIAEIGKSLGYKHLESHFVYVHRSLTREIAVFEKV